VMVRRSMSFMSPVFLAGMLRARCASNGNRRPGKMD
jgi:hypothetical protein